MVTRRFAGARASTFCSSLVAALWLVAPCPAQDPEPAVAPPAPAAGSGATAPERAPQDAAPVYGKIRADEVRLRCWPSEVAAPPVFEDVLTNGQIVQLGERQDGFRRVILPLGPTGFVSKRFSTEADDGTVTTGGTKVAFRYRPRTSEAPVAQLAKGTQVHVIGEQDDWFKVRVAGVAAWVSNADVEVVPSDPEHVAAYEALAASTRAEAQQRLDAIAAAAKQRELERLDMEAVQVVETAFQKELQKASADQQFSGLVKALAKVEKTLQKDGSARAAAASLRKRIETQQWVNEAVQVTQEQPPEVEQPERPVQPKDRLERFEAIGWLRYQSQLAEPGFYYLEKGGRRQFLLSCNTGRFDLSLFVGREVGVIGPRRSPVGATLSTLDVERLEVLGSAR
jgi:SH3-like domain-containing protein